MDINRVDNFIAYSILLKDYQQILEYVYPSKRNGKTYSHRIYEVFLRSCTEFENICKQWLIHNNGYSVSSQMNIKTYFQVREFLGLDKMGVSLKLFNPVKKVYPCKKWTTEVGPSWYRAYNQVKHNRSLHLPKASFKNLTLSIAAVGILLRKIYHWEFLKCSFVGEYLSIHHDGKEIEHFSLLPFDLILLD